MTAHKTDLGKNINMQSQGVYDPNRLQFITEDRNKISGNAESMTKPVLLGVQTTAQERKPDAKFPYAVTTEECGHKPDVGWENISQWYPDLKIRLPRLVATSDRCPLPKYRRCYLVAYGIGPCGLQLRCFHAHCKHYNGKTKHVHNILIPKNCVTLVPVPIDRKQDHRAYDVWNAAMSDKYVLAAVRETYPGYVDPYLHVAPYVRNTTGGEVQKVPDNQTKDDRLETEAKERLRIFVANEKKKREFEAEIATMGTTAAKTQDKNVMTNEDIKLMLDQCFTTLPTAFTGYSNIITEAGSNWKGKLPEIPIKDVFQIYRKYTVENKTSGYASFLAFMGLEILEQYGRETTELRMFKPEVSRSVIINGSTPVYGTVDILTRVKDQNEFALVTNMNSNDLLQGYIGAAIAVKINEMFFRYCCLAKNPHVKVSSIIIMPMPSGTGYEAWKVKDDFTVGLFDHVKDFFGKSAQPQPTQQLNTKSMGFMALST